MVVLAEEAEVKPAIRVEQEQMVKVLVVETALQVLEHPQVVEVQQKEVVMVLRVQALVMVVLEHLLIMFGRLQRAPVMKILEHIGMPAAAQVVQKPYREHLVVAEAAVVMH
jgi:hypothetical protein